MGSLDKRKEWLRIAAGLVLFGISFGYVEAAVVVYLRTIYDPIRIQVRPGRPAGDLFPLVTHDQLNSQSPQTSRLLAVEVGREAATLAMLAGAALAAGRRAWLPAFSVAFGTWDLFFYVFLKLLAGWPSSLLTWDILFLIPVPWAAPVLAPVIVSLSMIFCGLVAIARNVHFRGIHWAGFILGAVLIFVSFTWDFRNLAGGGMPHPYVWALLAAGELAGIGTFVKAARDTPSRARDSALPRGEL
jgi:hypothetical protein